MAVSSWNCLQGPAESLHENVDKLVQNLSALPGAIFEFDVVFVVSKQSQEQSLVEWIAFKVTFEEMTDINDVSEIFQCQFGVVLQNDHYDIGVGRECRQESFI